MALTADEAADIARDAGLSMADAVSLRALAEDRESATRIAATFAASDERRAVSAIFGDASYAEPDTDEEAVATLFGSAPEPAPTAKPGGVYVPREGSGSGGIEGDRYSPEDRSTAASIFDSSNSLHLS